MLEQTRKFWTKTKFFIDLIENYKIRNALRFYHLSDHLDVNCMYTIDTSVNYYDSDLIDIYN